MMRRFEVARFWRSRRAHLAVAAVLLFLVLMLLGFWTYAVRETSGEATFRYTFENRSYFNGLTFALHAFYFGFMLVLPIFAVTEASAQIAGDRASGALALILARPVTRTRLFLEKAALAFGIVCTLVALLWGLGLAVGLVAVGWGDLDLYPGVLQMTATHQHLEQGVALRRFALMLPAAMLAMAAPLALGLWIAAWSRSAVNAIGLGVATYLVLYVVSQVHFFRDLRPWLFPSHMAFWRALFQEQVDVSTCLRDAARVAGMAALFLALGLQRFRAREEA